MESTPAAGRHLSSTNPNILWWKRNSLKQSLRRMTNLERHEQHQSRQRNICVPNVIIEDILVNLPVKSLLRFKCVCKSWCSLFTKPSFARANFDQGFYHNTSLILQCDDGLPDIVEEVDLLKPADHKIERKRLQCPFLQFENTFLNIESCTDGILCMFRKPYDNDVASLVLWNPRINKYKSLAALEWFEEPLQQDVGFGYDSSVDDYKVVRILSTHYFSPAPRFIIVQVLNVKSNVWRTTHRDLRYTFNYYFPRPVCMDGSLYWIALRTTVRKPWIATLLRFDLAEETFQDISFPPIGGLDIYGRTFHLGVLRGLLYVGDIGSNLELWVMKEESRWVQFLSIPIVVSTRPLSFTKDGSLLMICKGKFLDSQGKSKSKFVMYDQEHNSCSQLEVCGCRYDEHDTFKYSATCVFSESLISPSDDHN